MKRLTEYESIEGHAHAVPTTSDMDAIMMRLAAYEDTELEPAMCANYKTFDDEAISKGVPFKRIVALMEADKAGRLVVLPCQSGEHVFALLDDQTHVWECEVEHAVLDGWRKVFAIRPLGRSKDSYYAPFGAFGQTVFLTREEADRALEGKRNA